MATQTYELIATKTLASAGALSFTSIPATFTDLILQVRAVSSGSDEADKLWFNNDTTALYSNVRLLNSDAVGVAGSAVTYTAVNASNINIQSINGFNAGNYGYFATYHIQNYASTNMFKSVIIDAGFWKSGYQEKNIAIGMYRSTSAINRIDFNGIITNLGVGSTASLYGIKAA